MLIFKIFYFLEKYHRKQNKKIQEQNVFLFQIYYIVKIYKNLLANTNLKNSV